MTYSNDTKANRMTATRNDCNGGALELLNAAGQVLAAAALDNPAGTVVGPVLTFAGFPKTATATAASTVGAPVTSARLRSAAPADVKTGLTVGLAGSGADVILSALTWAVGATVQFQAGPTLTHAA